MGKENPPRINNLLNNCIHFTLPFQNEKLHVFLVYIHPNSIIEDTIFTKAALYKFSIIIGDFNVNMRKNQQISDFINNTNSVKIDTPPTSIIPNNPSTTPDLLLCMVNILNNFIEVDLTPDLGSDHLAILIKFELQKVPSNETDIFYHNIGGCNMDPVNEIMFDYISNIHEISPLYIQDFNSKLNKVILENSPIQKKTFFNYQLPPFILKLIRRKRQLYRLIKENETQQLKTT